MLAIWRVHGLDVILREVWEAGIVLCGISAGSLCGFEEGLIDSFGAELSALKDGLGFLPFSHCPHVVGEALRRPRYRETIRSGELGPGYAADDGAVLRFEATRLVVVVCSRPESRAFHVWLESDGIKEEELSARLLEP
jgi:peptidase E